MTAPADVDESGAEPGSGRGRRRLRTLTGVLPVVGVVIVVVLGALLISPGLRHTVSESFARSDEHYIELFLADERAARDCPLTDTGGVRVRAALTSHLAGPRTIDWTIAIKSGSTTTEQRSGSLDARPGRTTRFGATLPSPSAAYTVLVTLSGRSERLVLHC